MKLLLQCGHYMYILFYPFSTIFVYEFQLVTYLFVTVMQCETTMIQVSNYNFVYKLNEHSCDTRCEPVL